MEQIFRSILVLSDPIGCSPPGSSPEDIEKQFQEATANLKGFIGQYSKTNYVDFFKLITDQDPGSQLNQFLEANIDGLKRATIGSQIRFWMLKALCEIIKTDDFKLSWTPEEKQQFRMTLMDWFWGCHQQLFLDQTNAFMLPQIRLLFIHTIVSTSIRTVTMSIPTAQLNLWTNPFEELIGRFLNPQNYPVFASAFQSQAAGDFKSEAQRFFLISKFIFQIANEFIDMYLNTQKNEKTAMVSDENYPSGLKKSDKDQEYILKHQLQILFRRTNSRALSSLASAIMKMKAAGGFSPFEGEPLCSQLLCLTWKLARKIEQCSLISDDNFEAPQPLPFFLQVESIQHEHLQYLCEVAKGSLQDQIPNQPQLQRMKMDQLGQIFKFLSTHLKEEVYQKKELTDVELLGSQFSTFHSSQTRLSEKEKSTLKFLHKSKAKLELVKNIVTLIHNEQSFPYWALISLQNLEDEDMQFSREKFIQNLSSFIRQGITFLLNSSFSHLRDLQDSRQVSMTVAAGESQINLENELNSEITTQLDQSEMGRAYTKAGRNAIFNHREMEANRSTNEASLLQLEDHLQQFIAEIQTELYNVIELTFFLLTQPELKVSLNAIKICSTYSQGLFLLKNNSDQLKQTKMDFCNKILPHFFSKMVIPAPAPDAEMSKVIRLAKFETSFANNKEIIFSELRKELHQLLSTFIYGDPFTFCEVFITALMERLRPAVDGLATSQDLVQIESLIQVLVFMMEDMSSISNPKSLSTDSILVQQEVIDRMAKQGNQILPKLDGIAIELLGNANLQAHMRSQQYDASLPIDLQCPNIRFYSLHFAILKMQALLLTKNTSNIHGWSESCQLSPEVLQGIFVSNCEFMASQTEFFANHLDHINLNNPSFKSSPLDTISHVKHHINHGGCSSNIMFRTGEILQCILMSPHFSRNLEFLRGCRPYLMKFAPHLERILLSNHFWDVDFLKSFLVGSPELKEAATSLVDLSINFRELFDEQSYLIRCLLLSVESEYLTLLKESAGEPVNMQELVTTQFFQHCDGLFSIITKAKSECKCREGHSLRSFCVLNMFKQCSMFMQDTTNNNFNNAQSEMGKLTLNKAFLFYFLDKMNWLLSLVISKEMSSEYLFTELIQSTKELQNSLTTLSRHSVPSLEAQEMQFNETSVHQLKLKMLEIMIPLNQVIEAGPVSSLNHYSDLFTNMTLLQGILDLWCQMSAKAHMKDLGTFLQFTASQIFEIYPKEYIRQVELLTTNNGSTSIGQQFVKFLLASSQLTSQEPHLVEDDRLKELQQLQGSLEFFIFQIIKRATIFSFGVLGLTLDDLSSFVVYLSKKALYGSGVLSNRLEIDSIFILRSLLYSSTFLRNPAYGQPGHDTEPSYQMQLSFPCLPTEFIRMKCQFFDYINQALAYDQTSKYRSVNQLLSPFEEPQLPDDFLKLFDMLGMRYLSQVVIAADYTDIRQTTYCAFFCRIRFGLDLMIGVAQQLPNHFINPDGYFQRSQELFSNRPTLEREHIINLLFSEEEESRLEVLRLTLNPMAFSFNAIKPDKSYIQRMKRLLKNLGFLGKKGTQNGVFKLNDCLVSYFQKAQKYAELRARQQAGQQIDFKEASAIEVEWEQSDINFVKETNAVLTKMIEETGQTSWLKGEVRQHLVKQAEMMKNFGPLPLIDENMDVKTPKK